MSKLPLDNITIAAVQAAMIAAIAKHGDRTPLNPDMSHPEKLVVLAEEFGEVARACTYDEGGDDNALIRELVQTAAMALSWAQSLDWPGREGMVPTLRRQERSPYTRVAPVEYDGRCPNGCPMCTPTP
jgi:NTP pyrophosphatase (non-canonical NTP hydrolase)